MLGDWYIYLYYGNWNLCILKCVQSKDCLFVYVCMGVLCMRFAYFQTLNKCHHIILILLWTCYLHSKNVSELFSLCMQSPFISLSILWYSIHITVLYFKLFISSFLKICIAFSFLFLQIWLLWEFIYCFHVVMCKNFSKVTIYRCGIIQFQTLLDISKLFSQFTLSSKF